MIEASGLSKWFGQVMALNNISVSIGPGITGLLGPNGAGKTTFLRMLTGQLRPSRGRLRIDGESIWGNSALMRKIGFCPEEDSFYDSLTGLEFVTALARLSGIPWRESRKRAQGVLELVDMTAHMHRKIQGYSRGMRQRVKLAQALVHEPQVVFLDEPLTGTDPVARRELRDLILQLGEMVSHVVVSSHVLHEVESLTQKIVLIHRGRVVADGDVSAIRDLMDHHPHRISVRCEDPRELAKGLVTEQHVCGVEIEPGGLLIKTEDPSAFFDVLASVALERKIDVQEFYSEDDNLAAVFRYLVER